MIRRHEQEIERICQAALERPTPEREAFLVEACGGNEDIRHEVDKLLALEGAATGFLETPALAVAARDIDTMGPSLSVGSRLGVYTIQSQLGTGGMGEVYRARDSSLGRDVAIKVLPPIFTTDQQRLARFEREARVLAALNHPNIATIHGIEQLDGTRALVLELVEGDTLADVIAAGPSMPIDKALSIARQVADALEASHEKGILHRDLKPENIKIRPDGVVKVLDFGLAKSSGLSDAGRTIEGTLLGTPAYMSPEQSQGKDVDRRTDIWAFGAVLFEMLSGQPAFNGATTVEVLSSVLKTDPDWSALPPATPAGVRSLIRRCLQKEPVRRLRDIADARYPIEEALSEPSGAPVLARAQVSSTRERLLWAAALVTVAGVAAAIAWSLRQPQAAGDEVRFEISTPPTTDPTSLAVSPDGRAVVFAATADGRSQLWMRSLNVITARPLSGTEGASSPFWSPDSRSIGFFVNGQLKRVDLDSGSVRPLGVVGGLGTWNRDGTILVSGGPFARVSANGGRATPVRPPGLRPSVITSLQFLPDGRNFFFQAGGSEPGIYIGALDGTETPRRIVAAAQGGAYTSAHLLFVRQGTLFAQAFDLVRLELTGEPMAIAEGILARESGETVMSVSAAGPIVYRTGSSRLESQFEWFDRSGKTLGVIAGSNIGGGYNSALSPDGQRLAISRNLGAGSADIWLLDLKRGVPSRFTFDDKFDLMPVWSPDGTRIAFTSNRISGDFDLYVKPADRSGNEVLLEKGDAGPPSDWSRDGYILRARQIARGNDDIWALPLEGDRKAFPVVESPFNEGNGQFSPDGKWIAYQSDESGQMEIYLQPFPGPAPRTVITNGGGAQARWRADGRELFYLTYDAQLMAVPIRADSNGVEVGKPTLLFRTHPAFNAALIGVRSYAVSPDGQRFLVDTLKETSTPITVLLNWKPKP